LTQYVIQEEFVTIKGLKMFSLFVLCESCIFVLSGRHRISQISYVCLLRYHYITLYAYIIKTAINQFRDNSQYYHSPK